MPNTNMKSAYLEDLITQKIHELPADYQERIIGRDENCDIITLAQDTKVSKLQALIIHLGKRGNESIELKRLPNASEMYIGTQENPLQIPVPIGEKNQKGISINYNTYITIGENNYQFVLRDYNYIKQKKELEDKFRACDTGEIPIGLKSK